MIPLDALHQITTVVTHMNSEGPCPDAVASLILIRDALQQLFKVIWVNYNTPEHKAIMPGPGLLFVDMTPYVTRGEDGALTDESSRYLEALAAAGTIVLDHHRGAADVVQMFGARGVFADEAVEPGWSGAMLALSEVWEPMNGPGDSNWDRAHDLAELAGIRDTWQRKDPRWREACAQACALSFWPAGSLRLGHLVEKLALGPVLLERDEARARRCLAGAQSFVVTPPCGEPIRMLLFEGTSHDASDVSNIAATDLVLAWRYEISDSRPMMRISCRSKGKVNCDTLGKLHSGGGHTGAAGFSIPVLPGDPNPYERLLAIITADFARLTRLA